MGKVLLQVSSASLRYVTPETWLSIANLDPGPHTVDLHVMCGKIPEHPKAARPCHLGYTMEFSRQFAVQHGYDAMFIVQSDIIFPPNTLLVLLDVMKKHQAGVVCPLTPERPDKVGTDNFVVCMSWNRNPDARKAINEGRDFRVTGSGSGYMCVLVRRDVFKRFRFPATASSDMHWYGSLQKARVKIICHVGLRLYHKQRDGRIIRGDVWVVEHWRRIIEQDEKQGKPWYHHLPGGKWWNGMTKDKFLNELPNHVNENRRWWSW